MTREKTPALRRVRARRWIALSTVAAAGLATGAQAPAAPAAGQAETPRAEADAPAAGARLAASTTTAEGGEGGEAGEGGEGGEAGEGGEGGEAGEGGEGGEGEGASTAPPPEASYLAELGYVEGHLRAGAALYEAGRAEMAETHMKHPGDEIYTDLAPKLMSRGAPQFDGELAALAEAVEGGAPVDEVKAALDDLLASIEAARDHAGGGEAERLRAVVLMAREAAREYDAGVENGEIANLHEYQDAWGFLEAARGMAAALAGSSNAGVSEAARKMQAQFEVVAPAFSVGLVPGDGAGLADPSLLYGAAARMELAALAVK